MPDALPELLVNTHQLTSDCEALSTIVGANPIEARLSDVARLFALPCTSSSQGDATYRVYLFETGEIGGIRPLLFAMFTPELGWVGSDILRGVELDAGTAMITHHTLGQWGGACGTYGRWQWNDFTLKMLEFRYRKSCSSSRSPENWVQVFPAK